MAQDLRTDCAPDAPPRPTQDGWLARHVWADDGTRLDVRERPSNGPRGAVLCDRIACGGLSWRCLAAALPQSDRSIVEGATHGVPIAGRQQVRERVEAFVSDRVLAGVGAVP